MNRITSEDISKAIENLKLNTNKPVVKFMTREENNLWNKFCSEQRRDSSTYYGMPIVLLEETNRAYDEAEQNKINLFLAEVENDN